jgi:hypothetical protein
VKCGRLSIAFQKRQYLLNFDERPGPYETLRTSPSS